MVERRGDDPRVIGLGSLDGILRAPRRERRLEPEPVRPAKSGLVQTFFIWGGLRWHGIPVL